MAEDSGAFKTKRQIRTRFRQFVTFRERRCSEASLPQETFSGASAGAQAADFSQPPGSRCGILKSA
jgi:hypothetical protein